MCHGFGCEIKDNCSRHIANPSLMQSYFLDSPTQDGKSCEYFKHLPEKKVNNAQKNYEKVR